jgi:GAF domain-containing protein
LTSKADIYARVGQEIAAVIDGETSIISRMATANCLLSEAFEHYFWTGFYLVDPLKPTELVVGPYQGSLGCLRIPLGRGVCGTCAQSGETLIVDDVHNFAGHIACDSRSQSEIVVPVRNSAGELVAVFDVDSEELSSFDENDKRGLEAIMTKLLVGAIA